MTVRSWGKNRVGSLVGQNDYVVTDATATGTVTGGGFVGALVGENRGAVAISSAGGAVTGERFVGGLGGRSVAEGSVSSSWASGGVTGEEDVGGIIGLNLDGGLSAAYWNRDATGQHDGVGSGNDGDMTALTTTEMQGERATATMSGLDFDSTWQVVTDPATTRDDGDPKKQSTKRRTCRPLTTTLPTKPRTQETNLLRAGLKTETVNRRPAKTMSQAQDSASVAHSPVSVAQRIC